MRIRVVSVVMLTLLLTGMLTLAFDIQPVMVISAAPWDGVPDDPTPAQAIWIDPQNRTCGWGEIFVVDVLVNVTSSFPCGGLWGWEYHFWWNNTVLDVLKIDTHGDAKPSSDLLSGTASVYVALNTTTDLGDGRDEHWYGVSALTGTTGFEGVSSLCSYTFKCIGYPNGVSILDIGYTKLVDSCTLTPHTSSDGYVRVCMPDVNDDGSIDIHDIVMAALAFGSAPEDDPLTPWNETLNWNPDADINNDGLVDIVDLVIIGINFGKTW